jgi:hypothetical protein
MCFTNVVASADKLAPQPFTRKEQLMAMRTFTVLDLVRRGNETARGIAHRLTIDLDIEYVILNEVGPASGYPEVLFVGTDEALRVLQDRYSNGSLSGDLLARD